VCDVRESRHGVLCNACELKHAHFQKEVCAFVRWGRRKGEEPEGGASSHQIVLFEVELQDGVFDGRKHEADVLSVRGTGEVGVDDLVAVGV